MSNLTSVAQGVTELRNLYGSGHGRDGRWKGVKPRHARLTVGAAAALATFLVETHLEQKNGVTWPTLDNLNGRYVIEGYKDGKGTGAEINLLKVDETTDSYEVQGFALWVNHTQPPAYRSPHLGTVEGVFTAVDGKIHIQQDVCEVTIMLQGSNLVVEDNLNCGGANVTFSGNYKRVGPPQFLDS